jgi:hypothetical protein
MIKERSMHEMWALEFMEVYGVDRVSARTHQTMIRGENEAFRLYPLCWIATIAGAIFEQEFEPMDGVTFAGMAWTTYMALTMV